MCIRDSTQHVAPTAGAATKSCTASLRIATRHGTRAFSVRCPIQDAAALFHPLHLAVHRGRAQLGTCRVLRRVGQPLRGALTLDRATLPHWRQRPFALAPRTVRAGPTTPTSPCTRSSESGHPGDIELRP
eukprot:4873961-Alexandrium_andersonii.AAC.1